MAAVLAAAVTAAILGTGFAVIEVRPARLARLARARHRGHQLPAGWPGLHGSWQVTGWFTGAGGRRLSGPAAQAMLNRIPVATTPARLRTWLASRDITYWIGVQPAGRYWLFQAATAVILITLAAAAGFAAVIAASRRT